MAGGDVVAAGGGMATTNSTIIVAAVAKSPLESVNYAIDAQTVELWAYGERRAVASDWLPVE